LLRPVEITNRNLRRVLRPGAHTPEFDFAGWNGTADNGVRAAYFLTAMIFAALAVLGNWRTSRAER
jgi:hypothetical protein